MKTLKGIIKLFKKEALDIDTFERLANISRSFSEPKQNAKNSTRKTTTDSSAAHEQPGSFTEQHDIDWSAYQEWNVYAWKGEKPTCTAALSWLSPNRISRFTLMELFNKEFTYKSAASFFLFPVIIQEEDTFIKFNFTHNNGQAFTAVICEPMSEYDKLVRASTNKYKKGSEKGKAYKPEGSDEDSGNTFYGDDGTSNNESNTSGSSAEGEEDIGGYDPTAEE